MITKPMLAATADLSKVIYPVYVSPKIDGIRCLKINGCAVSRTLKPIPNKYIREYIEKHAPDNSDGEIIVGKNFQETTSGVMKEEGRPKFTYYIFDLVDNIDPFSARYGKLIKSNDNTRIEILHQRLVGSEEELRKYYSEYMEDGYEGIMIRSVDGKYKFGRSTMKEGYLIKYKEFLDEEAEIIGFTPLFKNENEAVKNALGRTERSSAKEGKVEQNMLGSIKCRLKDGKEFEIGSGFTHEQRKKLYKSPIVGLTAKFKYQEKSPGGIPRFPVFLGIRNIDIDG